MSDERVERVEHVEHAIRGAIGKMDREWQKKIGGESASKSRMDDFAYVAARAAVAALDEEPTPEDVLGTKGVTVYLDEHGLCYADLYQEGPPAIVRGTGPTIDAAIRNAVANAKGDDDA